MPALQAKFVGINEKVCLKKINGEVSGTVCISVKEERDVIRSMNVDNSHGSGQIYPRKLEKK